MDFSSIGESHNNHGSVAPHPLERTAGGPTILQESNASNLLTLTSDSLPDIFRKPAALQQQQQDKTEERVSKWGYGPSCPSKLSQHAEETPARPTPAGPLSRAQSCNPWMKPFVFQQSTEDLATPLPFNISLDKSTTSDTSSALGLLTTIKAQPAVPPVIQSSEKFVSVKEEQPLVAAKAPGELVC